MQSGYTSRLADLESVDPSLVVGRLSEATANAGFATQRTRQTEVWRQEVGILQDVARGLRQAISESSDWHLVLEYEIPRRQKRPDAVILARNVIMVIEFKLGADSYDAAARWQAEEYGLDLRDFHAESAGHPIVPILCATDAPCSYPAEPDGLAQVWPVSLVNVSELGQLLEAAFRGAHVGRKPAIHPQRWINSQYRPALTIIEAAERLFSGHSVREISHSYADNLSATTEALVRAVEEAQHRQDRRMSVEGGGAS